MHGAKVSSARSSHPWSSMLEKSLQLLQSIKTALIVVVFVICTWLVTVGWKGVGVPSIPNMRSSEGNKSFVTVSLSPSLPRTLAPVEGSCSLVSSLKVLGKSLDRCATSRAVKLAQEEDIYVSVKTTSRNHVSRMLPILLTWFQTLQPEQVRSTCTSLLVNIITNYYDMGVKRGNEFMSDDFLHVILLIATLLKYYSGTFEL